MLFNSLTFSVFFLIVLGLYWGLGSRRARLSTLLASSLLFYAAWNPPFVLLLLLSIMVDYIVSHRIVKDPARKKLYLLISVCTNLGVLAGFKYGDFLLENLSALLRFWGLAEWQPQSLGILLPVGISFYTFQTMSYTIDVYRGQREPIDSKLVFATYVTFFPQLVAGPIVRAWQFAPQLLTQRSLTLEDASRGINRIATGLIKKVLVADWLAAFVEPVFANPGAFNGEANLFALLAYSFQIYFDFSGYCDIALGAATLLGFDLPENFRSPYLSRNIAEFWRRWHMTLSSWLRDYLYISLGGNRRGPWRTYRNLMLTMLLGGLWHGASWNFVVWGGIHGLLLAVHRAWGSARRRRAGPDTALPQQVRIVATFSIVTFAWIFFRCQEFSQALTMMQRIGSLAGSLQGGLLLAGLGPAVLAAYSVVSKVRERFQQTVPAGTLQEALYGTALGSVAFLLAAVAPPGAQFIYFQF